MQGGSDGPQWIGCVLAGDCVVWLANAGLLRKGRVRWA